MLRSLFSIASLSLWLIALQGLFRQSNEAEIDAYSFDIQNSSRILEWVMSENISSWYNEFDLCMLQTNSTEISVEEMTGNCTEKTAHYKQEIRPVRCRAGNAWPLKVIIHDLFDIDK